MSSHETFSYIKYILQSTNPIIILMGRNIYSSSSLLLKESSYINIRSSKNLQEHYHLLRNNTYKHLLNSDFFEKYPKEAWNFYQTQCSLIEKNYLSSFIGYQGILQTIQNKDYLIINENIDNSFDLGTISSSYKLNNDKVININGKFQNLICRQCNSFISNQYKGRICKVCGNNDINKFTPCIRNYSYKEELDKEFESKYYSFIYNHCFSNNNNNEITILELGVDHPIYDNDFNGITKEISYNILTNIDIKANIFRINPYNSSRTSRNLKHFLNESDYEDLISDLNFNIDKYLESLKERDISILTQRLGINTREDDILYSSTINTLLNIREYELEELKTSNNMLIDINEYIDEFFRNIFFENDNDNDNELISKAII